MLIKHIVILSIASYSISLSLFLSLSHTHTHTHTHTASSSDERFFSAALGSTDRDFRISFSNVTLSDPANPSTLQTAELFKTLTLDRWLDCKYVHIECHVQTCQKWLSAWWLKPATSDQYRQIDLCHLTSVHFKYNSCLVNCFNILSLIEFILAQLLLCSLSIVRRCV